ncbi:hypothetical protein K538_23790 [Agrobacterium tumefaciens GW4]|nr:hypothetical protein K538_23790 [Agrobacterium tumefaciens GW4]
MPGTDPAFLCALQNVPYIFSVVLGLDPRTHGQIALWILASRARMTAGSIYHLGKQAMPYLQRLISAGQRIETIDISR